MPDNNNRASMNPELSRRRYMQGTAGAGMAGLFGAQGGALADRDGSTEDTSFQEELESGEPLYGVSDNMQGISSAAIVANHPETDWIWVDAEHGSFWIKSIRQKLATFPEGTASIVRIPGGDAKEVEQVLDAGADGVIVPKKRDPEEVERFVESAYYPPEGDRGVGGTWPGGPDFGEYSETFDPFVVIQVETPELVNQIDEVASIDGIDSLLVGPADLSATMGVSADSSEFQQAVDRVLSVSKRNDIVPGYWIGSSDPSQFVEDGWRMLSLGSASGLLAGAISERIP